LRFNDLPQPVRERFVRMTTSMPRDPRILAHSRATGLRWLNYVGVVGALVTIAAILNYTIERGQFLAPHYDKGTYLALAAAVTVLLSSIVGIAFGFIWKPPPYPEGLYVFPSYLVHARGGELDVTPITAIGTPTVVTVKYNGSYTHTRLDLVGSYSFKFTSDSAAQSTWTAIAKARAVFRAMLEARDAAAIASVDPFVECTVSGVWTAPNQAPSGPFTVSVPIALSLARWAGALLIGVFTAGAYYAAIDALFEEERAEYDKANQQRYKRR
jgi:hypothetical protein